MENAGLALHAHTHMCLKERASAKGVYRVSVWMRRGVQHPRTCAEDQIVHRIFEAVFVSDAATSSDRSLDNQCEGVALVHVPGSGGRVIGDRTLADHLREGKEEIVNPGHE